MANGNGNGKNGNGTPKKKKKVSLLWPILLGLGAFLWWRRSKAAPPKPIPDNGEDPPPRPKTSMANFVGHPDFRWPHADVFPTEASFIEALQGWGYNAGPLEGSVLSDRNRSMVRQFQRDYNAVRKAEYNSQDLLVPDGLIGKNTIGDPPGVRPSGLATGMMFVIEIAPVIEWLQAVAAAREKLGE